MLDRSGCSWYDMTDECWWKRSWKYKWSRPSIVCEREISVAWFVTLPTEVCHDKLVVVVHIKDSDPPRPGLGQAWDCLHHVRSTVTRSGLADVVVVVVAHVAVVATTTSARPGWDASRSRRPLNYRQTDCILYYIILYYIILYYIIECPIPVECPF